MESTVRPPRLRAVSMRVTRERRPRGRPGVHGGGRTAGARVVPVGDQGLRTRGDWYAVVPDAGDIDRARPSIRRRHAVPRQRDEPGGNRARGANLSGEGRIDAARRLQRDGAKARTLSRRAAHLGSGWTDPQCAVGQAVWMVAPRTVVIVGGTRGIARALAVLVVARGDRVCLFGRNPDELSRSVVDLNARGTSGARFVQCDLAEPAAFESAFDHAMNQLEGLDTV